jgi:hypothetical protein
MVHTGIRALSEPIKFSFDWIPFLLLIWAIISAACLAAGAGVAYLVHCRRRIVGRSSMLTVSTGLALGLSYAFEQIVLVAWCMAAVVLLGPVWFRVDKPEVDGAGQSSRGRSHAT